MKDVVYFVPKRCVKRALLLVALYEIPVKSGLRDGMARVLHVSVIIRRLSFNDRPAINQKDDVLLASSVRVIRKLAWACVNTFLNLSLR